MYNYLLIPDGQGILNTDVVKTNLNVLFKL